ncbi:DUF1272 domain-containing protein [Paenalkalicoccus suaedae]|uniref:DUF1272 domain-containing protein n=1 Tax=Paenalkalicoccus suaedae TaxID=2592382 RepID=A0A859FJG5_9BACI|nr:TIGR04104 family putative zinc finger protein [Paenalkalicoccus suaedae]QKS72938.1 DUF1272 domain-containing protein [Paenalkalicoccus suaedae]
MSLELPTCEACKKQLTYKQAMKAQRFTYEYTHCPHCNEKQFVKTRKFGYIIIALVPAMIIGPNLFIDIAIVPFLIYLVIVTSTFFALLPFMSKFRSTWNSHI